VFFIFVLLVLAAAKSIVCIHFYQSTYWVNASDISFIAANSGESEKNFAKGHFPLKKGHFTSEIWFGFWWDCQITKR